MLEVKIVLDLFDTAELRRLWVNSSADRSLVKIVKKWIDFLQNPYFSII